MYKQSGLLVIAALIAILVAYPISTTNVSAGSSPTVTLETPLVKAGTREIVTIKVVNDTGENIENVLIRELSASFDEAVGGMAAAEDLELAADNLENAAVALRQAGENLKLAGDDKKASSAPLKDAAVDLYMAGENVKGITRGTNATVDYKKVGEDLQAAKAKLEAAGDVIDDVPENFVDIRTKLYDAGTLIHTAGTKFDEEPEENFSEYPNRQRVAENLKLAGTALQNAADNLRAGSLRQAGTELQTAASRIYDAAINWGKDTDSQAKAAGDKLDNYVDDRLKKAGQKLIDAAQHDNLAGQNLVSAAAYLSSAGSYIEHADADLLVAGDNLENAATRIRRAGDNLTASVDNVLIAGSELVAAAPYMASSASELGKVLGGVELNAAQSGIDASGDNLKNNESVNLTAAGDALIAAAGNLSAAAAKMKSTAGLLGPAHWVMTEDPEGFQARDVLFSGENKDYVIAPDKTVEFTFIWLAPTISIENDYTIRVWLYYAGDWHAAPDLTITVDGKPPSLTIEVTQEGVDVANLVGNTYQGGKATVTITSHEVCSLGKVYVENAGQHENFLPPLAVETVDNVVFKATFDVGEWDDNVCQIRVESAVDRVGNENNEIDTRSFLVDTRPPILLDNGLSGLLDAMVGRKAQAETGYVYWVDNEAEQTIRGHVEDNWVGDRLGKDNCATVVSVTIEWDGYSAVWKRVPTPAPDNRFSQKITLKEGLNSAVKVSATDWTGNTTKPDSVENLFVDLKMAEASFSSIMGLSAAALKAQDNYINDSTPTIVLNIRDPGYPALGLGIYLENVLVQIIREDGSVVENLENAVPWKAVGDTWTFENTPSELVDNWYRVQVFANDNLHKTFADNVVRFCIDTVAPAIAVVPVNTDIVMGTWASPTETYKDTLKMISTAEAGATVQVFVNDVVKVTVTAGPEGIWIAEVPLAVGANKIEARAIDKARNESAKVLYGYIERIAFPAPPVVKITAPPDGFVTDMASVLVEGTATGRFNVVTVNGVTVPVVEGKFRTSVALAEGLNVINVTAVDIVGQFGSDSVAVTRTVTPWATYAIIIVIIALVLAAIAIFRKR